MSVEFRCDQCQHLLRTGDDSVGRKARCPQCGNIQTVPAATGGAESSTSQSAFDPFASNAATQSAHQNPFALDPSPNPYAASNAAGSYSPSPTSVRPKIMAPAIGMLVVSVLSCGLTGLVLLAGAVSVAEAGMADDDAAMLAMFSVSFVLTLIATFGSIQMLRQRSYGLAMTAVIITLLPTGCIWCLSLPFGIWALIVLLDPQVRAAFH